MKITWITLLAASVLCAQDTNRATLAFSDPNGAKKLICSVFHGDITVKAYSGKEVIVEGEGVTTKLTRREPPPGMRRIGGDGVNFGAEQSGNEVRVNLGVFDHGNITIQVPADTSLKLTTTAGGDISVEGVTGEIEVNSVNGEIRLTNVGGAVVAHTMNGKMLVTMNQVAAKPMSFSTFNGEVDVTLPANTKADLSMKSARGDIFSDFDIALKASAAPQSSRSKGMYKVRFDRAVLGTINGGGPEIQFTTYNGAVYIRKK
jgi:hypothetical protein